MGRLAGSPPGTADAPGFLAHHPVSRLRVGDGGDRAGQRRFGCPAAVQMTANSRFPTSIMTKFISVVSTDRIVSGQLAVLRRHQHGVEHALVRDLALDGPEYGHDMAYGPEREAKPPAWFWISATVILLYP